MSATPTVEALIQAGGPHVAARMDDLEERLVALASSHGPELAGHSAATIAAGGKRLRPLLVFLAAGEEAAANDGALRAAVAVELVHSATLVHDDVLDRSALRRGRPTVVAAAGREMATAAGDFLFSRAFAELASGGRASAVGVLAGACLALAEGELIQRADAWNADVSVERYERRCELKTARLFEAACRLGALEGGAPEEELGAFGRRIGLAFQMLDDVLTSQGPRSGPASRAARISSTGRSTSRSSWPASATRGWRQSIYADCARTRWRRCATASRPPARWRRRARAHSASSPTRRTDCRGSPRASAPRWSWLPTAWSSASPRSPSGGCRPL